MRAIDIAFSKEVHDMHILRYISKYADETNFFNDQKKLDTMYYLMKGLPYQQIAEEIGKQISYVQRVVDFLRNYGLLSWGRWAPNVYKIGMKKSIVFLDWKDRELPQEHNFIYTTYIHHVREGETKVFVVYTYPKDDEEEIQGERGEEVTPFYYTYTRFTVPFFKRIDLFREFFDIFDSIDNDDKILACAPFFKINDDPQEDPITVYTCRYSELLPDLTLGILTDKLEKDFKGYALDVSYDNVKSTLDKMKQEKVIYPRNALYFKPLSYQSTLVKIETKEIYRIMKTFNQFNMFTEVALTRNSETFYLYIQYPFYQFSEVMEVLTKIDPTSKAYILTKFVMNDTIYYQWALKKFLESRSKG
jgi:hypothetical protein